MQGLSLGSADASYDYYMTTSFMVTQIMMLKYITAKVLLIAKTASMIRQ